MPACHGHVVAPGQHIARHTPGTGQNCTPVYKKRRS
jgi:hypothetical protein